jgi:hypothetical protein
MVAAITAALLLAHSTSAHAQATVVVTPSVSVGGVYDTNVLWRPDATVDRIWRVTPGLTFSRETSRHSWMGEALVDSEWFTETGDLSTPLARQHALTRSEWTLSPTVRLALTANYDNSMTPQELNLVTGIIPGRVRAWRWSGSPEATVKVTPRTTVYGNYSVTGDVASIYPGVITHAIVSRVEQAVGARTNVRVGMSEEIFQFETAGLVFSHTPLVGLHHRLNPRVDATVDAGARFTAGRIRPEVDARLSRRTTFTELSLDYSWTQATSLGIGTLVDVQRITGRAGYRWPRRLDASIGGGLYLNGVGPSRADVYRVNADITKRLVGALSIAAAYELDFQRGTIGASALEPGVVIQSGDQSIVPDLLRPPVQSDRLQRSVLVVRFVVSGPLRSASGPREPPAEPGTQPRSPGGRTR